MFAYIESANQIRIVRLQRFDKENEKLDNVKKFFAKNSETKQLSKC